jgi:hypothetical protein
VFVLKKKQPSIIIQYFHLRNIIAGKTNTVLVKELRMSMAKCLYLFDNLIEFASGRKTIEVSGIHNLEENS